MPMVLLVILKPVTPAPWVRLTVMASCVVVLDADPVLLIVLLVIVGSYCVGIVWLTIVALSTLNRMPLPARFELAPAPFPLKSRFRFSTATEGVNVIPRILVTFWVVAVSNGSGTGG